MRFSLLDVPRNPLLIVLSFVAPCVGPYVALCRTTWERYFDDPFVWHLAIEYLQDSKKGRARMRPIARSLSNRCPPLNRNLPLGIAEGVKRFAIAPSGKLIACGINNDLQILHVASHQVVTSWQVAKGKLWSALCQLCFSPDPCLLACAMDLRLEPLH